MSADGTQTQEVSIEGSQQEPVPIQEGDTVSRVIKRTVLRSEGDQKEVGADIPLDSSQRLMSLRLYSSF